MSDEQEQNCGECGRPLNDSRDFKTVKAERDAEAARADALQAKLLERTIKDAGFDPTLGVVQRLAKDFTGDLDVEAFKDFAISEGLTPAPPAEAEQQVQPTEAEQQLNRLQAAGDALRNASTTPQPEPDLQARIRAAEQAGDWQTSLTLKAQALQAQTS